MVLKGATGQGQVALQEPSLIKLQFHSIMRKTIETRIKEFVERLVCYAQKCRLRKVNSILAEKYR